MEQSAGQKMPLGHDVAGYDRLTEAIRALVNRFPGVEDRERVVFASLGEDGGTAFYPGAGAVVESETVSVTGRVRQICRYDFAVGVRLADPGEQRRIAVKEWLDGLGRWLEGQSVTADGQIYRLDAYPSIGDGRRFLGFERLSAGYLDGTADNHVETWVITLTARYENNFTKKH